MLRCIGRLTSTLLGLWFFVAAPAGATVEFWPAKQLWRFETPLPTSQRDRTAISAAGSSLWLLHPDGYIAHRLERTDETIRPRRVQTITTRRIELPFTHPDAGDVKLRLIAMSESTAWLVDETGQRLWHLSDTKWSGAFLTGERVGQVAATAGGLVVNTPANASYAFALFDPHGTPKRRFGERLVPPRHGLEQEWNRWAVAGLPDGRLIAAHRYSNVIRLYGAAGNLLWQKEARGPIAAELQKSAGDALDAIRVDRATCCWEARLAVFAIRVLPTASNRFAIQFGEGTMLEEYNDHGEWIRSTPVRTEEQRDSPIIDMTAVGDAVAVVTNRGAWLFEPRRGRRIDGRVVSEKRQPVSGATVHVHSASGASTQARTNERGAFSVYLPDGSTWDHVKVSAAGFRTWEVRGRLDGAALETIVLPSLLRQCVEVFDAATGKPIENFSVRLTREEGDARRRQRSVAGFQMVNPSGSACVDAPFDHPWTLSVTSPGYVPGSLDVTTHPSPDRPHRIALSRGAVLDVRVINKSASPVPKASVRITANVGDATDPSDEWNAQTDAEGHARIEGLPDGTFRLEVLSERFMPFTKDVSITNRFVFEEITLEAGAQLRVHVTTSRRDVEGALVTLEPLTSRAQSIPQCTTDEQGMCSVSGLAPGRYEARARVEGLSTAFRPVEVGDGDQEIELQLEEVIRLTGTVENRHEYPDLDLQVFASRPGFTPVSSPVDSSGRFAIEAVPTGAINIRVWERTGNSGLLFQRVTVPAGSDSHHIVLRLPPAAVVNGRIRYQGGGCASCSVLVKKAGAEADLPSLRARSDELGSYSIRVPGPGIYVIRAEAADGTFDQKVGEVRMASTYDFDLDRGRLSVTVRGAQGTPAAGARVYAVELSRGTALADLLADERGHAFLPYPAHPTRITATKEQAAGSILHPGPTGNSSVEIALQESSGIRLDLREKSGLPVYRATVRLRSVRSGFDWGLQELVRSDDSAFNLAADPNDVWDLVIQAPRYAPKTVHGVSGRDVHRITMSGGLTLAVQVRVADDPCAVQLLDATGRSYGISTAFPLGPVPLTTRDAVFNPIEPGEYTIVLHTCAGDILRRRASVIAGTTTPLVVFD